jgi:hypothetical protein
MTKISELKQITDPIKSAEAEHEGSKVALRISPLATFLLEGGLHHRIGGTKTRAATVLFEAAIQDWAAAQNIDLESEDFKQKYLRWLTRTPLTAEDVHAGGYWGDPEIIRAVELGEEVYEVVTI